MNGETIAEAWWFMGEKMRDHCVSQVVNACKELAAWKGDAICGVDGLHLSEERLAKRVAPGRELDMSPMKDKITDHFCNFKLTEKDWCHTFHKSPCQICC